MLRQRSYSTEEFRKFLFLGEQEERLCVMEVLRSRIKEKQQEEKCNNRI